MPAIRNVFVAAAVIACAVAAAHYHHRQAFVAWLPILERDAVVVTGSHTGIGQHAALTLARAGFTVFACVRQPDHGRELVETAQSLGTIDPDKIRPLLLDVTQPDQIAGAVETVSEFVGEHGLYGLFNNAGIARDHDESNSVEDTPVELFRQTFEVNFFGLLQTTKAFLPLIRRRKGRIVSNTSVAGMFAAPFMGSYASSKFAVEALMDSLRREVAPMGVRVSILQPGFIKTPILKTFDPRSVQSQNIYAERDIMFRRGSAKIAMDAPSARLTSEAVLHALRSLQPKTRYTVGRMSWMAKFLSLLPAQWADVLLSIPPRESNLITDEEIENKLLLQPSTFEL